MKQFGGKGGSVIAGKSEGKSAMPRIHLLAILSNDELLTKPPKQVKWRQVVPGIIGVKAVTASS